MNEFLLPTVPQYEHLFSLVKETKQALLLEGDSTITRQPIIWRLPRSVREVVYVGILIPFNRDDKPRA